jgi:Concanavalin A-like lectin/glucanases superfamily
MALTRPKIWDIDTTQIAFNDPLTVLHQGATSANIDVGFLFNRANGLVSNVAVYWSEANQSFIHAFTSNSGVSTDVNVAITSLASVTAGSIYTNGLFYAANGQPYTGAVTTYQSIIGNTNPSIYTAFTLANTAPTLVDSLPYNGNVMVSWIVTAKDNVNNRFTRTTIDSINDGANVYYTQYGTIKSNNSFNVATFTSNISGANINLYAVGDSSSVNITFERHVLGNTTPTGYINNYGPPGTIGSTIGIISTSNTTAATSTTTGALQIAGGAGIGGNLYTGGNAIVGNVLATGFFYANGTPFTSSSFNPASPGTIGGTTPGAATFSSLKTTQTTVTLGASAGAVSQGTYAIGIGTYAGYNTQGAYSVVIGGQAGQNTAGAQSVLIGYNAGFNSNNANVVAIGSYAGTQYQGQGAVAVGSNAGANYQANNAIAIGNSAGVVQSAPSIILNASGSTLNDGGVTGFFVKPTRNDTSNVGNVVMYNTTTGEHTYSNTISISGNITTANIVANTALVGSAGNVTVPLSGSLYFNGSSSILINGGTGFQFGSGNFTVEAWVYYTSTPSANNILFEIDNQASSDDYCAMKVATAGSGQLYFLASASSSTWINTSTTPTNTIVANQWYHIAAVRNGSTFTLYVNGTSQLTYSSASALAVYSGNSYLGSGHGLGGLAYYTTGYITGYRVVKGTAVYTSNFTAPTSPLTAISGTQLLMNVANSGTYLTDSSTNAFTVTDTGATFNTQSPFGSSVIVGVVVPSTSTTTGALVVQGGLGVTGNLYSGNHYITSNATSGTTTRVEANVPHPFMLMGAA